MTKMVTEESILRLYDTFGQFEPNIELSDWKKLAALYSPPTEFDRGEPRRYSGDKTPNFPRQNSLSLLRI